ncbi:hypothetical protein C8R46DRAFT_1277246 [Mycena filopes]|nr:hypothetical protein C8R46DRAFT_1277246 [Mycena filopes]
MDEFVSFVARLVLVAFIVAPVVVITPPLISFGIPVFQASLGESQRLRLAAARRLLLGEAVDPDPDPNLPPHALWSWPFAVFLLLLFIARHFLLSYAHQFGFQTHRPGRRFLVFLALMLALVAGVHLYNPSDINLLDSFRTMTRLPSVLPPLVEYGIPAFRASLGYARGLKIASPRRLLMRGTSSDDTKLDSPDRAIWCLVPLFLLLCFLVYSAPGARLQQQVAKLCTVLSPGSLVVRLRSRTALCFLAALGTLAGSFQAISAPLIAVAEGVGAAFLKDMKLKLLTRHMNVPAGTRRLFPFKRYRVKIWPITSGAPYTPPPFVVPFHQAPSVTSRSLFEYASNLFLLVSVQVLVSRLRLGKANNWPRMRPVAVSSAVVIQRRCKICNNTRVARVHPHLPLSPRLLAIVVKCAVCKQPLLPAEYPSFFKIFAIPGNTQAHRRSLLPTLFDNLGAETQADFDELQVAKGSPARELPAGLDSEFDESDDDGIEDPVALFSRSPLGRLSPIPEVATAPPSPPPPRPTYAIVIPRAWPATEPLGASSIPWTLRAAQSTGGADLDLQSNAAVLVDVGQDGGGGDDQFHAHLPTGNRKWDLRDCAENCSNPHCAGECTELRVPA